MAGSQLYIGNTPAQFLGMNDTVVFPYHCLYVKNPTQYPGYLTRNSLFTSTPEGSLPCTNVDEFWWKYFWLMRYYGFNLLRTSDGWGYTVMRDLFYNYPAKWDMLMESMLKMASWNQVYISFGMGSPNGYKSDWTQAQIDAWILDNEFKLDSPRYNAYVKFQQDVLLTIKDRPEIAFVEYANEPDGDGPFNQWWSRFGTKTGGAQDAWAEWSNRLVNDIRAVDHSHLDTMGTCAGAMFHGYSEDAFNRTNVFPIDIVHQHLYSRNVSYTNNALYQYKQWANARGKPCFLGEYGYDCWQKCPSSDTTYHYFLPDEYATTPCASGGTRTSYAQLFSKWDTHVAIEVGWNAMTCMMIPYYVNEFTYPGQFVAPNGATWPPSAAVMAMIPPVPTEDPNPLEGCSEGTFRHPVTCWDSSTIYEEKCLNGIWVPSGQTCSQCLEGQVRFPLTCSDGSVIYTEVCEDGNWQPSDQICPPPQQSLLPILLGLGGLAFVGMLSGGKKKW